MNYEDAQTSLELTLRYYQGEWGFDGKTRHDFDEVHLRIDDQQIRLTQKREGLLVRQLTLPNHSTSQRNYLLYPSANGSWFYLRDATWTTMSCGESNRNAVPEREDIVWEVPLKRLTGTPA